MKFGPHDEVALRRVTDLDVAPDGSEVVYAISEADPVRNTRMTRLWRQSVKEKSGHPLTTGHSGQRFPRYSPDGSEVAFVSDGPRGEHLMVVRSSGGRPRDLLPSTETLVPSEVFVRPGGTPSIAWSPDSRKIACLVRAVDAAPGDLSVEGPRTTGDPLVMTEITERLRGGPPVQLCVIDSTSGKHQVIGESDRPLGSLQWSGDGRYVYAVQRTDSATGGQSHFTLMRYSRDGSPTEEIISFDGAAFAPVLSPDGTAFVAMASRGTTHAPEPCLMVLSADGCSSRDLTTDDLVTFSDASWSPDNSSVVVVADAGVRRRVLSIDVSSGESTTVPHGDGWIEMLRASADGTTLACVQSGLSDPGDVWIMDSEAKNPTRLSSVNPHLDEYELARGERIEWRAGDGTVLEGVILYPPDHSNGNPSPFIIDYHGGPAAHVGLGWNGQRQVFASAGYVVFAPNFRGSTGYGAAFSEALRGDIGGVPYTDSIDGIEHLIENKIIDPERLFAFGHSWGGYMTNWTAAHTDRFRAIVSSGSICNLLSVFHTRYSADVWRWRLFGAPSESFEQYVKWSPLIYADNVTTPVLFLNGAIDRTTPPTQGQEMFTALRHRNIPSEHVIYPREGHPTNEPHHQIDRMSRILEWFERFDV